MVIMCISFIICFGCGGDINTPNDYVEPPAKEEITRKPLHPKTIRYNDDNHDDVYAGK